MKGYLFKQRQNREKQDSKVAPNKTKTENNKPTTPFIGENAPLNTVCGAIIKPSSLE